MTPPSRSDDDTDRALDRLLRATDETGAAPGSVPDDGVILAYLEGRATEAENDAMAQALDESVAFRREVAALARQLEELTSDDAAARFDAMAVTRLPERRQFLREHAGPGVFDPLADAWHRFVAAMQMSARQPLLGYGLALVFAAVAVYQGLDRAPSTRVDTLTAAVQQASGITVRGGGPGVVRWRPVEGVEALELRLRVPDAIEDGTLVSLTVQDRDGGSVVTVVESVDSGGVMLTLPAERLLPGAYKIDVRRAQPGAEEDWSGEVRLFVEAP